MRKISKQKLRLVLKIFFIVFFILIATLAIFRNSLLEHAIAKIEYKLEKDYECKLTIKKASFNGISGITVENIVLVPKQSDTLCSIQNIKTSINLWRILIGDIQLNSLEIKNGYIQLTKNNKGRNFDAFLKEDKVENQKSVSRNYAKSINRLLSKFLNLIPTDMQLVNLSLRINDLGRKIDLSTEKLALKNHRLTTKISVITDTFNQQWVLSGYADPREKKADIQFFNSDLSPVKVPYLEERFAIISYFDKIRLAIEKIDMNGGELHIDGFASVTNLNVNHPKIATKNVEITTARFDYRFLLSANSMAVDSSSILQINKIKIRPFAEYNTAASDPVYKLQFRIEKMNANDFISSLPKGLFSHFDGMEVDGKFKYQLDYEYHEKNPKSLVFDSKLEKENLRILKYGEANLNKINQEFIYRAIENGVSQRAINIGLSNPNFTPLDQISPYLQKCVLTSEDPSFFSHRGFINEAFKQSILKNIRTKKFSRGASTISMQLVKNVFLTREKTLSRKLEEILLVYILENNRIVSKKRMLEVYFNIIEWGPNIYGIGEASAFYFQKKPADLNLKECLFLASIVPKPKKFMFQFNENGALKSRADNQQNFIKNLMLRRGLLTPEDTIGQTIPLHISGPATNFLKLKARDSIPPDSLFIEEIDIF